MRNRKRAISERGYGGYDKEESSDMSIGEFMHFTNLGATLAKVSLLNKFLDKILISASHATSAPSRFSLES